MDLLVSRVVLGSVLLFYCNFKMIETHRRIIGGHALRQDSFKKYMVYLVQAEESERSYDSWICGGVIVTDYFILTSAACVEDVKHMYAIQGIIKYISIFDADTESCFNATKKKVVEYCVPQTYEFSFKKPTKWSRVDIALAKVESPYKLNEDWKVPEDCAIPLVSPGIIPINFYEEYQEPDTDVFVLGWGHNESYREEIDDNDYNEEIIRYAAAKIVPKEVCKEAYAKSNYNVTLNDIIDTYMICSDGIGFFDSDGNLTVFDSPTVDKCTGNETLRTECLIALAKMGKASSIDNSRRNGICQNDHGGPLVTWIGSQEYVVGVASVFLTRGKALKCTGPYLYASTFCSSGFLRCVLKHEKEYKFLDDSKKRLRKEYTKPIHTSTKTNRATKSRPRRRRTVTKPHKSENIDRNKAQRAQIPLMPPPSPEKSTADDDDEEILKYLNFLRGGPELEVYCNQPAHKKGFNIMRSKISWRDHKDGPAANEIEEDLLKLNSESIQEPLTYKKTILS